MYEIEQAFDKYKGISIESLYDILRSMVEKADADQLDISEKDTLLKDIDVLHAYILLLLGMEHHSLEMLVANHPEVYDQVLNVGNHIQSLI
ncbi:hypothetical protein LXE94_20950 [Bacillus subtilis]|uniref:hypothetical protein n=1 Tax=Bacillus subtilis TaxID=1423 RepID=UPI00215532B3|nr:hypothetical protein [Bacillus subtilis]MED3627254.1 hypothetical protein [Bacillus subtilis]UVB75551.1 hypothetical protein LXE94_20950 [Bacillus subtilis]